MALFRMVEKYTIYVDPEIGATYGLVTIHTSIGVWSEASPSVYRPPNWGLGCFVADCVSLMG